MREKCHEKRVKKKRELKEKSDRLYKSIKYQSESNDEFAESSLIFCTAGIIIFFILLLPVNLTLIVNGWLFGVLSCDMSSYELELYEESYRLREEANHTCIHGCG